MTSIKPLQKNERVCEKCFSTYVINGDESDYWCQYPEKDVKVEGLCEFCRPTGKYSLNKI